MFQCLGRGCPGCSACGPIHGADLTDARFGGPTIPKPRRPINAARSELYARICAAAAVLGYDEKKTSQTALWLADYPRKRGIPARTVDDLSIMHLRYVAQALEGNAQSRVTEPV
jgi:hypothetical protein